MITFPNIAAFAKEIKALQTKHDKLIAWTLTGLAFDVRKDTQAQLPKWVRITRPFLPNSVIYKRANTSTFESSVSFLPRAADIASLLEWGGYRAPKTSRNVSVPKDAKRTAKGSIPKSQRPRQILARKDTFVGTSKGGTRGVWRRLKDSSLSLLYVFSRRTRYAGSNIRFFTNGNAYVQKHAKEKYASGFRKMM